MTPLTAVLSIIGLFFPQTFPTGYEKVEMKESELEQNNDDEEEEKPKLSKVFIRKVATLHLIA
jgi:hypothetical protein